MSLTDKNLLLARPHPNAFIGGEQRLYKLANGYGLSVVNGAMLRSYEFAWEVAVLTDMKEDGSFGNLTYATPLTDDAEVFYSDEETNAFIEKAIAWGESQ